MKDPILKVLETHGPMDTMSIVGVTGLHRRTVGHHLKVLKENGIIRCFVHINDQRKRCYGVKQ